ncbi:MAG: glycosyltransferase [Pseudomonadota bacterium]
MTAIAELEPAPVRVSIVIKALNEAQHIDACVRSAVIAAQAVGGEVILADSGSSDGTVEIAAKHPILVVQLANHDERRCGIGPQLGYEQAQGEFIYILDGDMELDPEFLPVALAAFDANPKLGGVAGLVEETSEASYQFRARQRRRREATPGPTEWLDMGGLYRAAAVRETGYLSDRNLHAYEEQDLGLRLGAHGWLLERLDQRSVRHHGYTDSSLALLKGRWRTGYLDGAGEMLRVSLGKPYFWRVVMAFKHLFVGLALWAGLLLGLLLLPVTPWVLGAVALAVLGLIAVRVARGSTLADACFAQVVWQTTALALIRGFFTPKVEQTRTVAAQVLARP